MWWEIDEIEEIDVVWHIYNTTMMNNVQQIITSTGWYIICNKNIGDTTIKYLRSTQEKCIHVECQSEQIFLFFSKGNGKL